MGVMFWFLNIVLKPTLGLNNVNFFNWKPIVIVDGILILNSPELRSCFDDTVFISTSEALRFTRRLNRDVRERGRTPNGVKEQFQAPKSRCMIPLSSPVKCMRNIIFPENLRLILPLKNSANWLVTFRNNLVRKCGEIENSLTHHYSIYWCFSC